MEKYKESKDSHMIYTNLGKTNDRVRQTFWWILEKKKRNLIIASI